MLCSSKGTLGTKMPSYTEQGMYSTHTHGMAILLADSISPNKLDRIVYLPWITTLATSNGLGSLVISAGGASSSMTCMMAREVIISVMMVCGELCHLSL